MSYARIKNGEKDRWLHHIVVARVLGYQDSHFRHIARETAAGRIKPTFVWQHGFRTERIEYQGHTRRHPVLVFRQSVVLVWLASAQFDSEVDDAIRLLAFPTEKQVLRRIELAISTLSYRAAFIQSQLDQMEVTT